jgi:hypothetical protein
MTETTNAPDEAAGLIALLVQANASQLAWTTNQLIEGLTEQAARAEATLAAVRANIEDLLSGRFAPTDAAILSALYPTAAEIGGERRDRPGA